MILNFVSILNIFGFHQSFNSKGSPIAGKGQGGPARGSGPKKATWKTSLCSSQQHSQQMASGKLPGLDGQPASFFQHFWTFLRHELLDVFKESFNNGTLLFMSESRTGIWLHYLVQTAKIVQFVKSFEQKELKFDPNPFLTMFIYSFFQSADTFSLSILQSCLVPAEKEKLWHIARLSTNPT